MTKMPHAKIKQALSFVREAQDLENTANASSSWETLEESAAKYNLAAYYLKNYARGIVRQVSNGSSDSEESTKTKDYLVGKIAEFEKKANELLVRVGNLKAEEQQQREQQLRQEQLWQEQQRKEQLRQEEQRQEQLHQEEQRKEQQQQQRNHIPRRHESEGGNSSCGASELEATANKLLTAAMDHEKSGEVIEALTSYVKAADFYLRATTESLMSPERVEKFKRITTNILGRVDELKRQIQGIDTDRSHSPKPETSRQYSNGNQPDKLTPDEIKVLTWSSTIASKVFVPWIEEEARAYNYSPPQPWIDPDGVLKLSEKQKETFFKWKRPSEILAMRRQTLRNITMIDTITPDTIKQYCVSDCSFIAGLCISAEFERRFKRRLITSLIHPQDPNTGKPIYNPKGVYMVKLWFNGVERRVLVDDLLPVDKGGELLCSHTKNKDGCLELWVPILEKAYMKLCGGYDFPGSNSGVDLFCLTGWIPERIYFPEDPADVKDFETPAERAWTRLSNAYRFGDCLATVSTSNGLPEEEAERKGLFTRHAYAVLKIVQLSNGTKLLQLKNPWASKGWKGPFLVQDKHSWSDPAFCEEVGCDADSVATYDDGIFWMSWDDVFFYLRNIHVSWRPELFQCRTKVHGRWDANAGPEDDSYNVSENPQYTITLSEEAILSKATLWLLLSRHVTKQEQEGDEISDFLTLHIHRIKDENEFVYYPDSNCILVGAYTNNQHVLVRYDAVNPENKILSIVLSQDKKSNDIGYTLSCYCTEGDFKLGRPNLGLAVCQAIKGSWKLRDSLTDSPSLTIGNAGGPLGRGSFGSNPQWSVRVPAGGSRIQVECTVAKDFAVNVILARHGYGRRLGGIPEQKSRRIHVLYEDPVLDTGAYRRRYAVAEAAFVSAGLYTLVVSTFEVGHVGQFYLRVLSSKEIELSELD